MRGIFIGHSHPRPCSGEKTLRRCRNKEEADNVILIDVDSENSDNVVIIDIPESFPKRNRESHMLKKDEKWLLRNVINIDDDETLDSSSHFGANNVNFAASTSLNRESFCVAEDSTPVRLSKCKRTYSGKASTRNCYGLDADSECDLSGNDYPDCELVEDFSGKVQELWERAVSRRRSVHSGIRRGHDSTSSCINKDHQNAESKNATRHPDEISFRRTKRKSNSENGGSPVETRKNDLGFTHLSGDAVNDQEYCSHGKSKSQAPKHPSIHAEQADCPDCDPGNSSSHIERRKHPVSSNFSFQEEPNEKFNYLISTAGDKENSKEEDKDGQLPMEIGHTSSPVDASIINEREKLKETDEYRRAMEEEWASRQQALQIQAEEARRERQSRKREKAESMRLLDMERRQKQRLEEMRSIKKKDEENMNLKDTIRAEVRNQLKKLEVGCRNMASLLQSLGIKVDSWPNPSRQQVQAAYKRALLTFHPDRASRSDIRQLVEAEEKFKLINRMKEKFPPS